MSNSRQESGAIAISEAESAVMEVLWQQSPLTAEQVVTALADSHDWREPTIKTLLGRLMKKGAISAEADGRRYRYAPQLAREDYVGEQSQNLIQRLFDGRVAPLVAHFSEQQKLSRADIAELRALLDELADEEQGDE